MMVMDGILREISGAVFDVFLFPGNFLLSQTSAHVPAVAALFATIDDDTRLVVVVFTALLAWASLAFAVRMASKLSRDLAWITSTRFRISVHRWSVTIARIRSVVAARIRALSPRRTPPDNDISRVDFDEIDLAVLLSAAARGPGMATSAPELADRLKWRPGEIQCSIDKLKSNKMLDYAFGSTDGFDTYCLSQLGTSFVGMLRSRHRASV